MRYVVAQTVLDLFDDLLILYIPVKLIWNIQVKRSQKVALAFSLCLTFFMVLVTIARISGNLMGGLVDIEWEFFFIIIAGEIGVILTALTAFRTLFVSRHKGDNRGARKLPELRTQPHSRSGYLLKLLVTPSLWRSKMRAQSVSGGYAANEYDHSPSGNLPDIPRAHVTGVRTFIDRCGRGTNTSHIMESQAIKEEKETWPLHKNNHNPVDQV
ncbi:hypothetical protein MMC31_008002 [Peltigera leucophlebia]|nr:hypothetical protein [Peltigera leucophlebia]